jgi:hypothetical protein
MKDINTDETYETWLSKYGGYANSMTMRDYFAAKAMQGVVASAKEPLYINPSICAPWAYEMADAMLKARQSNG